MNQVFKGIIRDINALGSFTEPRGQQVKELLMDKRKINSLYPIVDLEQRPFNWKYFAGELSWYLKKDCDISYISKYSKFWSNITNPDSNEINSNYGNLLFNEQLKWVIDSLNADENTRQAIAFLNQPKYQFKDNKDFVCTMYLNFFIRDNKLHMKVNMRSNDIFYGLTFDAPFFSFVHQHVLMLLDKKYELGDYYHCADNIHYYDKHSELANDIVNRFNHSEELNRLELKKPLFNYVDGEWSLTPFGRRFIKEVDMQSDDATQDDYKKIIKRYM